jgi:asparagine synthase (glutamine-hydrolysing)
VCGIIGIVARNAHVASDILERATLSLAHRGPDDSGTVIIRESTPEAVEVGLGNRRLAILDLSPLGHQPMQDADTGNWIAFNGEIYNFREVRGSLERDGAQFSSHSDTEVLLKAYARWGEACLEKLRGMFAFAIWDAKRHRLFVARDPMGIKPLYYCATGSSFLFASEVRTLLGTGLVPRRLCHAGLVSYLTFGSVYDPLTIVEGVNALRPGHYLVWEKGEVRETMYWDMASRGDRQAPDRKPLEDEIHATLDESVRMQMVSDVPVGVFLSGGIDSSVVVGLLARSGIRPETFSIVFREADFSEAEFSRLVARQFATNHHEIFVSQNDALEAFPGALLAMDQPTIDGLNTYLVSRQTRAAGIKVALSGLGGDELFGGYSSFQNVPSMERFSSRWHHLPGFARRSLAGVFSRIAPSTDQNRKLSSLAQGQDDALHPYFLSRMLFTSAQCARLLVSLKQHAIEQANAPLQESLDRARDLDPINRVSYLESRCYMLNTLLRDSDVMSMAHGLEVRVPLIDHTLAAKLMHLPGDWKLDPSTPKPLLVSSIADGLPSEIVHRPKRGFTLPFEHWMKDQLREGIDETLNRMSQGPLASVMNSETVRQVWDDFQRGATSWSRPWSLFVLQRWCELHQIAA